MTDERPPADDELELEGEDPGDGLDGEELGDEPRASEAVPPVGRGRQGAALTRRATSSDEELPYIDDRASEIWVAAIVAVFAVILAYGLLFGKAGALIPPTPSPTPSPTAAPTTAAPSPSLTAVPSVSITPAPSITATPAPSVTPTPVPTVVLTASPAPSPS